MDKKEELLQELETAREILKDYSKFVHLFSDDEGKRTLAKLNRTLGRIQLHFNLSSIKEFAPIKEEVIKKPVFGRRGALVKVKPVNEKYQNKTYLGFLIGEVATNISVSIENDKLRCDFSAHNPAIFVPELGEVIYGMGSWWSEIESEDDFKDITDVDIDNVWYVKLYREMALKKQL